MDFREGKTLKKSFILDSGRIFDGWSGFGTGCNFYNQNYSDGVGSHFEMGFALGQKGRIFFPVIFILRRI